MAANLSRADAIAPIITFISVIVLGIIISEFILTKDAYQLPIILFSFFAGLLIGALELRAVIGRKRIEASQTTRTRLTNEEAKNKLARYVADLFDEDIPFDEIENKDKELSENENKEKDTNT